MIDLDALLRPVSAEAPCGEDISYDPKFLELETLVAGKPETQFSAAEEPDWKAVRDASLDLAARSKHLRVAATLATALVELDGAGGLRDGLDFIKRLVESYWGTLYPKLDPEEGNDPTERANILAALSTPVGTFGDPLRFIERIRRMPLANSPRMGRYGLAAITGDPAGAAAGTSPVSPAQVAAAFRDSSPADLESINRAIGESVGLVRELDLLLTEKLGADKAPDFGALLATLEEARKAVAPYLADGGATGESGTGAGGVAPPEGARTGTGDGEIRSREDAIRALDRICAYYARTEPSSPLPYLLRRAKRLAQMDFVEVINELAPDAIGHLQTIIGAVAPPHGVPATPEPADSGESA